jgi:[ribosomal protein S18]-alanine N-acetyltransferase
VNDPFSPATLAGFSLRGYAPGYLDAMFRLDEICFSEPFRFTRADMRRFAEAPNAQVLLALADEELAGFSIVNVERSRGRRVGYLTTLDVAPNFRGRGLAGALMQQAEAQASAADCAAMLLHVFTGNKAAIGLYEKLGYERMQAATNFYGSGLGAWVYRKVLG